MPEHDDNNIQLIIFENVRFKNEWDDEMEEDIERPVYHTLDWEPEALTETKDVGRYEKYLTH